MTTGDRQNRHFKRRFFVSASPAVYAATMGKVPGLRNEINSTYQGPINMTYLIMIYMTYLIMIYMTSLIMIYMNYLIVIDMTYLSLLYMTYFSLRDMTYLSSVNIPNILEESGGHGGLQQANYGTIGMEVKMCGGHAYPFVWIFQALQNHHLR